LEQISVISVGSIITSR